MFLAVWLKTRFSRRREASVGGAPLNDELDRLNAAGISVDMVEEFLLKGAGKPVGL